MTSNKASSWFDETSATLSISEQAKKLDSFLTAVADGKVTDAELKDQETRLVKLMKEIEPKLDPTLHAKVTELLCELTAYDMMQVFNLLQQSRPKTAFRG
jgi:3-methyladenine DNA glycosylase Tag